MQRETAANRARTPTPWNDINWCRNRKLVRILLHVEVQLTV